MGLKWLVESDAKAQSAVEMSVVDLRGIEGRLLVLELELQGML